MNIGILLVDSVRKNKQDGICQRRNIDGTLQPLEMSNLVQIKVYYPNNYDYIPLFDVAKEGGSFSVQTKLGLGAASGKYRVIASSSDHNGETTFYYNNDKLGDKVVNIIKDPQNPHSSILDPKFTIVKFGQTITWINKDSEFHLIASGDPETRRTDNKVITGFISTGNLSTVTIESNNIMENAFQVKTIRYFCTLHLDEHGTIVVIQKDEEELTMSQRQKLLDSVFEFVPSSTNIINSVENYLEAQNKKILLERYFDPNVLDLVDNPDLMKPRSMTLTIAFWDISGFSHLCALLKEYPQKVVEFLRDYSETATKIIFDHTGVLDKFIGDGVMAFFGFQSQGQDGKKSSICAVEAALEFKNSFEELRNSWTKKLEMYIPERIGIGLKCGMHTGMTIVGNIGTQKRDQFTAVGPAVNLASRLQEEAKDAQIIVSSTTKSWVIESFDLEKIEATEPIKGFPDVSEYYEVKSKK